MKVLSLSVSLVILLAAPIGAAEGISGNDLYQLCAAKVELPNQACGMWISGFVAGLYMARTAPKHDLPTVCPPDEITGNQARLIIEKYMRERPDMLHLPAHGVAYIAIAVAFPCPKAKN